MSQKDADALLQYIQDAAECFYLSDLHRLDRCNAVIGAIQKTPDTAYMLSAWNGALSYLFPEEPAASCAADARETLLALLRRRNEGSSSEPQ